MSAPRDSSLTSRVSEEEERRRGKKRASFIFKTYLTSPAHQGRKIQPARQTDSLGTISHHSTPLERKIKQQPIKQAGARQLHTNMLSPITTRTTSPIFSFLSFLLFLLISTAAVVDANDCRTMIQRSLCGIGDNGRTFCAPNTLNMCKNMGRYQVGDPVLKSAKCPCQYQVCMTFFFPFLSLFFFWGFWRARRRCFVPPHGLLRYHAAA